MKELRQVADGRHEVAGEDVEGIVGRRHQRAELGGLELGHLQLVLDDGPAARGAQRAGEDREGRIGIGRIAGVLQHQEALAGQLLHQPRQLKLLLTQIRNDAQQKIVLAAQDLTGGGDIDAERLAVGEEVQARHRMARGMGGDEEAHALRDGRRKVRRRRFRSGVVVHFEHPDPALGMLREEQVAGILVAGIDDRPINHRQVNPDANLDRPHGWRVQPPHPGGGD